jgi:Fe-S-cluster containining protein
MTDREYEFECPRCGHCCQQREWVGLTDEEIHEIRLKTLDSVATNYEAYRAIEAKLKEKNSGS